MITETPVSSPRRNGTTEPQARDLPLCMDLDGTLVRTDTLWEALLSILRVSPLQFLALLGSLWRGKPAFKKRVAELSKLDVSTLPYRPELVAYLRLERGRSRRIILVTGADQLLANQVADYLGVFDEVIGSNGTVNLTGSDKRDLLVQRFGEKGFVYFGDSARDIAVWRQSATGMVVGRPNQWTKRLRAHGIRVSAMLPSARLSRNALLEALRPHHWLKNVLVLVPILLANQVLNWRAWLLGSLAAAALSLAASGMYVLNDILDLESDRRHPVKRFRPLASGALSIATACALVPLLLGAALTIAALLPAGCVLLIASYAGLSLLYSVHLKKIAILDVIFLAGLYCFRIFLGGAATGIHISKWTMLFGLFLFTSLAFLKRFTELQLRADEPGANARRGYIGDDLTTVGAFGIMSGYIAALVFALYLNSPEAALQYVRPAFLWFVCPALLYWISHVWMLAQRGQMHTDPIVFAARDKVSYGVFAVIAGILWLAAR